MAAVFAFDVAVFAGLVGLLDVEEEEIEVVPVRRDLVHDVGDPLAAGDDGHAAGGGDAAVERIAGEGAVAHLVERRQLRQSGRLREAAEQDAVGASAPPAIAACMRSTAWRRRWAVGSAAGVGRAHRQRRHAELLRIGVGDAAPRARGRAAAARNGAPRPGRPAPRRLEALASAASSAPQMRSHSAVGMRPARRSVRLPSASTVAKLPRAATSPAFSSRPSPSASRMPRPIIASLLAGS